LSTKTLNFLYYISVTTGGGGGVFAATAMVLAVLGAGSGRRAGHARN